jgi:hypothetical protein
VQAQLERAKAAVAASKTWHPSSELSAEPSGVLQSQSNSVGSTNVPAEHSLDPLADPPKKSSAGSLGMLGSRVDSASSEAAVFCADPTGALEHESIKALRELRRLELVATGAHVVAPCAHDGPCPMDSAPAAAGWCHFRQRFERTELQRMCVPISETGGLFEA